MILRVYCIPIGCVVAKLSFLAYYTILLCPSVYKRFPGNLAKYRFIVLLFKELMFNFISINDYNFWVVSPPPLYKFIIIKYFPSKILKCCYWEQLVSCLALISINLTSCHYLHRNYTITKTPSATTTIMQSL